jgi:hypothetical protein
MNLILLKVKLNAQNTSCEASYTYKEKISEDFNSTRIRQGTYTTEIPTENDPTNDQTTIEKTSLSNIYT